ncbi:hypothetical protein [Bacillus spongiae]|uniref:hypothetical protein n=1 Tax=Bacillus spongiae TaxID=2683610 RepID=UPI003AF5CF64
MHSEKKKIRGWKRHKRKIERWKHDAINLNMDNVRDYQRTYVKLWIHPFYALIRRNPPVWYNRLLLDAMLDVYLVWYQKMKQENENFYLKIWLYDPHFINSQIVVAYKDCLNFYDKTFDKREEYKPFPYEKFPSLKDKLEQFEWESCIETVSYDETDLNEWVIDGLSSKKEVQAIKNRAYNVSSYKSEEGITRYYHIDTGNVWVGTFKA